MCSLDNSLYAVGGWVGSEIGGTVEKYNPDVNKWSVIAHCRSLKCWMGTAADNGEYIEMLTLIVVDKWKYQLSYKDISSKSLLSKFFINHQLRAYMAFDVRYHTTGPVFTKLFRIRIKIRIKLNIPLLWTFFEAFYNI